MELTPAVESALATLRSLAHLPGQEDHLYPAIREVQWLTEEMVALADLRHSTKGILEMYEKTPALEAIDFKVGFRYVDDFRPYRDYFCEFVNVRVRAGSYESEKDIDDYTEALYEAYMEEPKAIPGSHERVSTALFSNDLCSLFNAADANCDDFPGEALAISTTRAKIVEALGDNGNIDALAASLFPGRWLRQVEVFELPDYGAKELLEQSNNSPRPRG